MPDRRQRILQGICFSLGAILLLQLAIFAVHATFSRGLKIPALPMLPPGMEAQGTKTNSPATGTNDAKSTAKSAGTNAPKAIGTNSSGTGSVAHVSGKVATNEVSRDITASDTNTLSASNRVGSAKVETSGTNGTNIASAKTNTSVAGKSGTNSPSQASKKGPRMRSGPGGESKIADLPAAVRERIDRITQGEILAPVMRPMPMALLGIAGESAFLRSPDGQTGLVKEGDQLGSLKLLRIGTNRVLIEQEGEKKELMIFEGLGGQSLLPKTETTTTNEPPKKSR